MGEALATVGMMTPDFNLHMSPPSPNGCAYYRMALPGEELVKRGHAVAFGLPVFHSELGYGVQHDEGGFFTFDVSMFKLLMHQSVVPTFSMMRGLGTRLVVDVDDFHYGLPESNVAFSTTNPHTNAESNRMYYEMGIRKADTVIVSTEFLANFYSERCRDVILVRNSVCVDDFTPVTQVELPAFGWVGGTLWRSGDIELLGSWLPQFAADHGVRVQHSGHIAGDPRHFGVRVGMGRVDTKPMTAIADYPTLFSGIGVGLVPLNNVPFSEAKSFLKGIEFAAAGIPFIASPTREYEVLREAGVGRLAATPDEWRDHATELLDVDVRREEAVRQRRIVEEQFDISKRGDEWVSAILG